MAGQLPDKLLGVREGFRRYFHEGLDNPVPVSVVSCSSGDLYLPLPLTDQEILSLARQRAQEAKEKEGSAHDFYVGTEAGLSSLEIDGEIRHFVHGWTVILGLGDEAWGSSGSIQLPTRLIEGLDGEQMALAIPGTRRSGGMMSSLTGQLESRRSATALSTVHALSTLMYGLLRGRPGRRR